MSKFELITEKISKSYHKNLPVKVSGEFVYLKEDGSLTSERKIKVLVLTSLVKDKWTDPFVEVSGTFNASEIDEVINLIKYCVSRVEEVRKK